MLSRPECDDLIARRSEAYGYPDSFLLSADLVDLIFYTTQDHASAVTCILNILSDAEVSVFWLNFAGCLADPMLGAKGLPQAISADSRG